MFKLRRPEATKGEVVANLEQLATIHVEHLSGRERKQEWYRIYRALQMAAWYGAKCAAARAETAADALFDGSWLRERRRVRLRGQLGQ